MIRPARSLLREWGALALLLVTLLLLSQRGGWMERADLWIYDTALKLSTARATQPPADPLILAIDETSLAQIGRWPWPRRRLAELMQKLTAAGADTVVLDIVLAEADDLDPSADAQLAEAIRLHSAGGGRVILPVFAPGDLLDSPPVMPLPSFARYAERGHAHALVDTDGLSRRVLPLENIGDSHIPHLAWIVTRQTPPLVAPGTKEADAARGVSFAGPTGYFPRLAIADFLAGRIDVRQVQGRTVLVGATATGLMDRVITPLAPHGGAMPGVEFIANVIHGLRSNELTRRMDETAQTLLSLGLLTALLAAYLVARPRQALLATVALCALSVLGAWLGLAWFHVWWGPASLSLVAALAYPLWSWRRLEASLAAMERETQRIAGLASTAAAPPTSDTFHFLDPVEKRIQAVSRAVDRIAAALSGNGDPDDEHRHRDEMLRHLAHDLRSPLISLRGLADELRGELSSGTESTAVARIDQCARRALDLSEQFILFGRAESLAAQQFREVNLVDILHQATDDLWEDGRHQGARILCHSAVDGAWAHGDYRLLHRAMMNLGWNALRHGPSQGLVSLFLELDDDGHLHLGVRDQGRGFPSEGPPPAAASRAKPPQGHGLGLAFVRRVAEKHDIDIAMATDENGFAIWMRFPPPLAPAPV